MKQPKPKLTDEPDGWPKELSVEPFPEIALARLPEDLREALRALWQVIGGGAQFFAWRAHSRPEAGSLGTELEALCRDLETLSAFANRAGRRSEAEPAALRTAAFEVADLLSDQALDLRAKLHGGQP